MKAKLDHVTMDFVYERAIELAQFRLKPHGFDVERKSAAWTIIQNQIAHEVAGETGLLINDTPDNQPWWPSCIDWIALGAMEDVIESEDEERLERLREADAAMGYKTP